MAVQHTGYWRLVGTKTKGVKVPITVTIRTLDFIIFHQVVFKIIYSYKNKVLEKLTLGKL